MVYRKLVARNLDELLALMNELGRQKIRHQLLGSPMKVGAEWVQIISQQDIFAPPVTQVREEKTVNKTKTRKVKNGR